MNSFLIKNAMIAGSGADTPDGWILVEDGVIAATGHGSLSETALRTIDVGGGTVFPGFIDVHNHGAVGVDVNDADTDGLLQAAAFLAKNGVTAWVPTLVPDSDEKYRRTIAAIDRLMEVQSGRPVANAVGVHYEGVFANETMCGALRPQFFKKFTGTEIEQLPRLRDGVHMTTIAPEIEGGVAAVRELSRQGWIVSIGHTRADTHVLDQAFSAGGKHLTHFYNAMTGLHHREVGVVGWGLMRPDVTFDIIADGVHVHDRPLEFACRTKGADKVLLISDSVAPTGSGDGAFELWGERITVRGGRTENERGSIAGSVITMFDAVSRMRRLGFSDAEVAMMASANPAGLLGLAQERGSVEAGKRADLVILDSEGELSSVFIGGVEADK